MGQSSWRALQGVGQICMQIAVTMYREQCMIFSLVSKSLEIPVDSKVWVSGAIPGTAA